MQNYKTYVTTLPNFIEIQKISFCWFISQGLVEELETFSSIFDFNGNIEIRIFGNEYKLKKPKYNEFESKQRDSTYSARIYTPVELRRSENNLTVVKTRKNIFIGTLPLMTTKATFIINGCERVIINQIIRSPGIYFKKVKNQNLYTAVLISNKGSWLKFELQTIENINNIVIYLDKSTKITVNELFKEMGLKFEEFSKRVKYPNYFLSNATLDEKSLIETSSISSEKNIIFSKIFNLDYYNLGRVGRLKLNERLQLNISEQVHILTYRDIIAIIDQLLIINFEKGLDDDIDHLKNKKVRSVGELLQTQFHIGLTRLDRTIKERILMYDPLKLNLNLLLNPKPLMATIKEFFGSSQLSQFMDQTNPLAALTHQRKISTLGSGGLNNDHVSFAVRDIHPSHYGRICPIETPEGENAGLIASLTTCAKINSYGFIETPFWKVDYSQVVKKDTPVYLTADIEDQFKIAPADIKLDKNNFIIKKTVPVRYKQNFISVSPFEVDFISISTVQSVSIAAALIPFFEHDDANRVLMGSNMQRQSVPLLLPQKPIIGTGLETQIAVDSGMVVTAFYPGTVKYVSSKVILIEELTGKVSKYQLQKYLRSNQDTCINNRPIVWVGEKIKAGQVIADGPSTNGGELALGQNVTVAYMPWQGYNFEDAILINERLVYEDLFTSIHIEKYDLEVHETDLGPEKITKNLPYTNSKITTNLDKNGVIYKGTYAKAGDILVGKVTPKNEEEELPEGKLLQAIFGEKIKDVKNSSLYLSTVEEGRVLDIKIFNQENGDELPPSVLSLIRIFLAQIRKIKVGDKIAGRHGNKGIISRILPREDMPYLPDGTSVDVVLNPLGVPSRMNVGQLYECLLGLAGHKLNRRFKILPFDEMYAEDASRILVNKKLRQASLENDESWIFNPYAPGKITLLDGRTGKYFKNPVSVGRAYMLKLIHLVDNKIHARATGPYSLITQQPLGGRGQNGGQRFGEMEVWALEAFGAAYNLQELLTIKSDDISGRNNTYDAIIKGNLIPNPGLPESFKLLIRELQAIGLDIITYKIDPYNFEKEYGTEINLMENYKLISKQFSSISTLNDLKF